MTTFTVATEACQAQFQWTGVQASFPCGFPALEAADLLVQYASGAAASFTGSIAGGVLTVTTITSGSLGAGSEVGGTPLVGSTADFEKLFVDDAQKWAKVMREANIKPE